MAVDMQLVERKGFDGEVRYEVYETFYIGKDDQHLNKESYLGYIKELPESVFEVTQCNDVAISIDGKHYLLGGRRSLNLWWYDDGVIEDSSIGMIYDMEEINKRHVEVNLLN